MKRKTSLATPTQHEAEELTNLGWIQIESHGEENLYFSYIDILGHVSKGFCKTTA